MTRQAEHWERRLARDPLRTGGFTDAAKDKIKERIRVKKMKSRWLLRVGAAAACIAALGAGILFREELADKMAGTDKPTIIEAVMTDKLADQGEITLKVQDYGQSGFMWQYGRAFMIQYPSVRLKIVSPKDQIKGMTGVTEVYRTLIEQEKPDVLRLPFAVYIELARDGLLLPLDNRMKEDSYGTEQFYEPVIDTLREAGGGELYGLSSEFTSRAVYVNPKLFEQHNVQLPQGALTWKELLQVASSFQGSGVYGLAAELASDPLTLVDAIGRTEGLQFTDKNGTRATVSGAAWEDIWTLVADNVKSGTIYTREPGDELKAPYYMEEAYKRDPFMTGEAAMRVDWHHYAGSLLDASQWPELTVEWTALPEPVREEERNTSSSFMIEEVFAIAADSTNVPAAWELLKVITSEAIASRTESMLTKNMLSARSGAAAALDGGRREAFYRLDADPARIVAHAEADWDPAKSKISQAFYRIGTPLMQAVLKGEMSVPDALDELQAGLDAELAAAISAKEADR
jgi:multiple sugar transport system substrate-binding protein